MNIEYLSLNNFDIESVLMLFNKVYSDYYWPNQHTLTSLSELIDYMNIDKCLSTIVTKNNKLIGLALVAKRESYSWLYCFGIIPSERNYGYGKQFLTYLLNINNNNNIKHMGLEVLLQNKRARNLYYKNGFKRYCYLDSYSLSGAMQVSKYQQYSYQETLTDEAYNKYQNLPKNNDVWSRRYNTLLKRKINWLTAYYKQEPVAILGYNNHKSLSIYRLDSLDQFHSERALHKLLDVAQINNPQCVRKVVVNISHNNIFENKIINCVGFKRFVRQEYLLRITC
ncbi:GNAT family N-acetyltransferase [Clostridium sp. 'deep sea']|uniref:GNAT family N-acetyltransferase n=1 Tax=Clostridium sp. 'deep sea' TaxID=2779445 RepID=UPI001896A4D5|nr:GNAT family N-acetyltransferase [Clostridium sp. 'deep sea']QOR34033.1 GNAT family N-acetyltransferase [Clostridium sp. 'deep sea']